MILGIDIGTTAVKAVLLDEEGCLVAEGAHGHDVSCPEPGWAEADPEDWWNGLIAVCRQVGIGDTARVPQVIGVSGMVPALVLLDGRGEVLRPSIQQNDARAAAEIGELRKQLPNERLFEATGSVWNQQLIAPKILWLQRHEPDLWARVERITGSYEYIAWRLTGTKYCEANWALESGFWTPLEERWFSEALDLAGVPRTLLGPVRRPHEIIGEVSAEVAGRLGLRSGIPVIAGSADHIASILPIAGGQEGPAIIKLGGAGDLLLPIDTFAPVRSLFIDYHCVPRRYVVNGCMATSGALLKWFSQELAADEPFESLDRKAETIPAGSDGLVTLPYFLGEKTPIHDPMARGTIIGLTLGHGASNVYRSLLEGIAFGFRHHIDVLEDAGHAISELHVTDGGARSRVWRSILASVLGRPVVYARHAHVGGAAGVAILAGVAIGLWDWDQSASAFKQAEITAPDPKARRIYDRIYRVYRDAYLRLSDLYPFLAGEPPNAAA